MLEQLGSNKITKYFGLDKSLEAKEKEIIYKVVIAATELSKTKTGALIVFEREIRIGEAARESASDGPGAAGESRCIPEGAGGLFGPAGGKIGRESSFEKAV